MRQDVLYWIYGLVVLGMTACGNLRGVHPLATWLSDEVWDPRATRPAAAGTWHK